MLSYSDLKKGVKFILEEEPWEVLDSQQIYKAQDVAVVRTKIKNLVNGRVLDKTFHQRDTFEEADLKKIEVRFLFSHRGKLGFCQAKDPSKRFELTEELIGSAVKFIKPNQILTGILFKGEIINVIVPIKVQLKVIEAPPGIRGNRAEAGNKQVVLETGAKINVPLFIKEGSIIEINTETGEYVKRVE